jgi:trans-2-enoyl-CoA reductase
MSSARGAACRAARILSRAPPPVGIFGDVRCGATAGERRRLSTAAHHPSSYLADDAPVPTSTRAIAYDAHGHAPRVLRLRELPLPPLGPSDVLVRFLASPVNPSDVNTVEGTYPLRPDAFPAVGGHEGVGVVVRAGANVDPRVFRACPGDPTPALVVPDRPGLGTWREWAVIPADALRKVPPGVPIETAAQFTVNPPTAYRMLTDYVHLRPGAHAVILNAATSAVGRAAIQICAARRVDVVALLRARDDWDADAETLRALGATLVLPDDPAGIRTPDARNAIAALPPLVLGLNGVGGASSANVASALARDGAMITYGGMARRPVWVPTGAAIFKNIKAEGFWLTRWTAEAKAAEAKAMEATREEGGAPEKTMTESPRERMFRRLAKMAAEGELRMPATRVGMEGFVDALENTPRVGATKTVLWMDA